MSQMIPPFYSGMLSYNTTEACAQRGIFVLFFQGLKRTCRFGSKPIIWKELQLHNIIFTARSSAIFLLWLVFPLRRVAEGVAEHFIMRFIIVAGLHYSADLVTEWFQDRGRTTTRDMPWDQGTPDWVKRWTKKYYAVCQLFATTAVLGQTGDLFGRGVREQPSRPLTCTQH